MASDFASKVTISSFPRDGREWRVTWLGQIKLSHVVDRTRQPSVSVSLSKVSLIEAMKSFKEPPIQRDVSVGALTVFRVGDVYVDGRLRRSGTGTIEIFEDVDVAPSSTEIIKTGSKMEGHYLLPLEHHPGHLKDTKGYCVRVPLSDGRQMLVPCLELARFYFGSSSVLLARLFQPDCRREQLYDPKRSHVGSNLNSSHIRLATDLPGRSASDVARLAGNGTAWRCAAQIGLSMADGPSEGYIRTHFPFAGRTTLRARGRWLPFGDEPNRTFVVHELLSCTHPLPFRHLTYHAEYSTAQSAKQRQKASSAAKQKSSGKEDPTLKLVEKDAGNFAGSTFAFEDTQRFPDLAHKMVYRKQTDPKGGGAAQASSSSSVINEIALGEPGSNERIRPVEFEAERLKEPPPFLHPIIEVLHEVSDLKFRPLTTTGEDGWTVPLDVLFDDVPEQLRWVSGETDARPPDTERRRSSVLRLERKDWARVWVVIEHDRLLLASRDATAADDQAEVASWRDTFADQFPRLAADAVNDYLVEDGLVRLSETASVKTFLEGALRSN